MNPKKAEHVWKNIAQQLTEESDPTKIIELAGELIHALDKERKPPRRASEPICIDSQTRAVLRPSTVKH